MILNPYSRVVIFDDEADKINPLLSLFKKNLVPQLFIDFSNPIEDIEDEKKLKNIRLIFTDFIKGHLTGSNPLTQLTNVINAITTIISKDNGPFLVVAWSVHTDALLTDFEKILKEAGYVFETIVLNKEKYLKDPNLEEMLKDINGALGTKKNFINFINWENEVKKSASRIIEPFVDLKESEREKIIKMLSKASIGNSSSSTDARLLKGFYNTMTSLLYDEIEKSINFNNSQPIPIINENSVADDISFLNTKLMIDKNIATNDSNYPGNVYLYDDFLKTCTNIDPKLHEVCGFEKEDLKKSFFDKNKLKDLADEDLRMICVEISPYCDHAQNNMKKAKLIAGFICNESLSKKFKKGKYIYTTQKLFLSDDNSKQIICLSFRHIFRVDPNFVNNLKPLFRIRKEMTNEIQHETAFYLSRPGLTTVYED